MIISNIYISASMFCVQILRDSLYKAWKQVRLVVTSPLISPNGPVGLTKNLLLLQEKNLLSREDQWRDLLIC